MEPQRGPVSLAAGEGRGSWAVPLRQAGSLCSVWTPVSWAPRDREEGETHYGANIEELSAKLASRVLFCFTVSRGRMQSVLS